MKKDLNICIYKKKSVLHIQGEGLYKVSYTILKLENIQLPYTYNLTPPPPPPPPPPQTHGGLRETILSLEAKARKVLGGRGLVKISASLS